MFNRLLRRAATPSGEHLELIINITVNPILAQIGPIQLDWSGALTTLGMVLALRLGWRRARAWGMPASKLRTVVSWAILGGLLGARLLHILDHLPYYMASPWEALAIDDGGVAMWGTWLGGAAVGIVAARRVGLPVWECLDIAAPALLLGEAVALVGALVSGAAWGTPTGGPWGIVYWNPRDVLPPDLLGVPIHPYPLYLIIGLLILLAALWVGQPRFARSNGRTFVVTLFAYSALQLGLGPLRASPIWLGELSEGQLCAVGGIVIVLMLTFARSHAVSAAVETVKIGRGAAPRRPSEG